MNYSYYGRTDSFFEMYLRAQPNSFGCVIGVDAPESEDLEMVLFRVEQDFQDWLESKTSQELVDLLKFLIERMSFEYETEEGKKKKLIWVVNQISRK